MRVSTGPVPLRALEATLQVTAGAHSLTVLGVDWAAAFTVVLLPGHKEEQNIAGGRKDFRVVDLDSLVPVF